jgi:hypothetical protein
MWCPKCGAANADSARFCKECGQEMTSYQQVWDGPVLAKQSQAVQPYQAPQNYQSPPGYQAPPYQAPGYQAPQYQLMPVYAAPVSIPNHMVFAIFSLWFCLPTGIPAVVYASQVKTKLSLGDVVGAQTSSNSAKTWCWVSFWLWIVLAVIPTLLYIIIWIVILGLIAGASA